MKWHRPHQHLYSNEFLLIIYSDSDSDSETNIKIAVSPSAFHLWFSWQIECLSTTCVCRQQETHYLSARRLISGTVTFVRLFCYLLTQWPQWTLTTGNKHKANGMWNGFAIVYVVRFVWVFRWGLCNVVSWGELLGMWEGELTYIDLKHNPSSIILITWSLKILNSLCPFPVCYFPLYFSD